MRYELRREPGCGMGHLVDGETDGVQRPWRSVRLRVRLVLLHDRHDHVTLVAGRPGYADVELRVRGRRVRAPRTTARVIAAPPPAPGQHGTPRLLRVQRRFGHPVVRADVHDVQLRKVPGKVLERHPADRSSTTVITT